MKTSILTFVAFLLSTCLWAQQAPFEQQQVLMVDGQELSLWISLNEVTEELYFKETKEDMPEVLQAAEVESFKYGGHQYYTLPLREGYYTYFKVQFEGKEFAVLEKAPSYKTLRLIVNESNGSLALRKNKKNEEFSLCFVSSFENMAYNEEFKVDNLIFLAVENELKLCYMVTEEYYYLWDDLTGDKPGKRTVENMFEAMVKNPEKISAIQEKVKRERLDVRDPQQLIVALGAVYQ